MARKEKKEPDYDVLAAATILAQEEFNERWFELTAVIPAEIRVLWEEVSYRFRLMGITHENPEVERGMIIEYLMADWLTSNRPHRFDFGP